MTGYEVLTAGGILIVLLTLVEITPLKINPWSALAKAIGKAINSDVLKEQKKTNKQLDELKEEQRETRERLDKHVEEGAEAKADEYRTEILNFNTELLRNLPHTEEDFNNILSVIDKYEAYCTTHPEYPNNRAIRTIEHIKKVYDERLEKNDFAEWAAPH